jgi:ArsR family transcriptional regulator
MATAVGLMRSPKQLALLAEQYKALGDENRLKLMQSVMASIDSEACVCDLTPDTGLAQSTVSHHLKILVDAGLLERSQRGKWAYFTATAAAKKLLKLS